jgi:hypothetical protein
MRVGKECLPCLVNQAIRSLEQTPGGFKIEHLRKILRFLEENFDETKIPAILGTEMHRLIKKLTRSDPFKEKRETSNKAALRLLKQAEERIRKSKNPLAESFKIALAGNVIDFGIYDTEPEIREILEVDKLEVDDTKKVEDFLRSASDVLYLCDNAGEIAFDRLCIEELKRRGLKVTAVVKSTPILNDATLEDAEAVGLTKICQVITCGTDSVGVIFHESSEKFKEKFNSADLIIAKGQGHYETLDERKDKNILFLLKAKCIPVARSLGVKQRSSVALFNQAGI